MTSGYNRKKVFRAACLGMLLFGIGLITLGSVLPDLTAAHSLDAVRAGTLISFLPAGILVGSLLFGPAGDRYGYRILLTLSALLMAAGFGGLAFAARIPWLSFSVFHFGLGGGAINGATNAVVADISNEGKGASLSLLGVFFGIGALGMPLLLSLLRQVTGYQTVVAGAAGLALLTALLFAAVRFPAPKQAGGLPLRQIGAFFSDITLLIIALFLFFQSALEGLINNWSTTYLTTRVALPAEKALLALSASVAGMTVMRLLIGSVMRRMTSARLMVISLTILAIALALLAASHSALLSAIALFLTGAGLAAGFPVMLGIVGGRYPTLSATAFSFVMVIALTGNTIINYSMGVVAENHGIGHLLTFTFAGAILMAIIAAVLFGRLRQNR